MNFYQFGDAPKAKSDGFGKITHTFIGTEDKARTTYDGRDVAIVRGAAVRGKPDTFEFAVMERPAACAVEPTIDPEALLTRERIASLLNSCEEICQDNQICYYASLTELATAASGSKHWSMGEVFVYARSTDRFIVMKQIAPSSCEMMTLSNSGFHDVLTAYRFTADELEELLERYMRSPTTAPLESARI